MFQDRITKLALRRAHSRVATPVIIRSKPGRLRDVRETVRPFVEEIREFFPRITQIGEATIPFTPYPMKIIERFNMLATTIPREVVFLLAENPNVEMIYSDEPVFGFFNTIPEEGVFKATHRLLKEIEFTSTYWTKQLIGADIANQKGYLGKGITVAITDTGASRVHEQLRRVRFKTTMKQYRDENGHGTWCTACVGGKVAVDDYLSQKAGQRVLCEGMAPECDLLAVKCLGYFIGMGSTSGIIDAIDISIDNGASIVSMSLGGTSIEQTALEDPYYPVMDELLRHGIVPVIAAGNEGPARNTIGTPGALPQVLTVGAYDPISGKIAEFSSRGPTNWHDIKPDVVAPGVNVDSAIVGMLDTSGDGMVSRYSPISGTSMATPHVAGLVALMMDAHLLRLGFGIKCDEIKRMMAQLGMEKSNMYGWGAITWDIYEKWMSTEYSVEL